MKVAVISSVYGDYDSVNVPVPQTVDCEFIMVTDKPVDCKPWKVIVEPRPRVPSRLASRIAKCNPWLYTDADIAIWVDADIWITSKDFVKWCVESLGDNVLCQWIQPGADVHEELRAARFQPKWDNDPLEAQIDYYFSQGYPDDGRNTYWCGMIIRSRKCPDFGDDWLAEMVRWSCQDQIGYAFTLFRYGLKPGLLPMADYEPYPLVNPQFWRYEHYLRFRHSETE